MEAKNVSYKEMTNKKTKGGKGIEVKKKIKMVTKFPIKIQISVRDFALLIPMIYEFLSRELQALRHSGF